MDWFNYYGLIIMVIIMIPNIVYAVKNKGDNGEYNNKAAIAVEQIGRYGCFAFMIFNIPYPVPTPCEHFLRRSISALFRLLSLDVAQGYDFARQVDK